MNKFKIVMTTFAIIAITVALTSYRSNIQKPFRNVSKFATITKLYDVSSNNIISPTDPNKLVITELKDQSYWSAGSLGSHGNSNILKGIQYNSTELTFQQAINIVGDYYATNNTLPPSGGLVCGFIFGIPFCVVIWRW